MTLAEIRTLALRQLIPAPRLRLSDWIEANIRLPEGTSALPGAVRLWPYQRAIADAIADPLRRWHAAMAGMPFSSTKTGIVKPHSWIERAICAICSGLWTRALRG
jgi:hypothetical protein